MKVKIGAKKLHLGGHVWKVRMMNRRAFDTLHPRSTMGLAEDQVLAGLCLPQRLTIDVATTTYHQEPVPSSSLALVLLHEVMHAVVNHAGLDAVADEVAVAALAETMYEALRRNPWLVDAVKYGFDEAVVGKTAARKGETR